MASNAPLQWTTAQVRLLIDCAKAGLSAQQTASTVGRSLLSIKAKAGHLGLSFHSRPVGEVIAAPQGEAGDAAVRDEAYVRAVLFANVYGFGRTILVHPAIPPKRGRGRPRKADLRLVGGVV